MDFSFSDLNYNFVETLSGFEARAAFTVNSAPAFKEGVDIVPTIYLTPKPRRAISGAFACVSARF